MRACFLAVSAIGLGIALGLAACSSASSAPAGADAGGDSAADAAPQPIACGSQSSFDLSGVWALYTKPLLNLQTQQGGAVAMCPVQQQADATLMMLLSVGNGDGGAATITPTLCSVALPHLTATVGACEEQSELLAMEIDFPAPFIAAIPKLVTAPVGATATQTQTGGSWSTDPFLFDIGTRAVGQATPQWMGDQTNCGMFDTEYGRTSQCATQCVSDCSAVVDDDFDGWPAITTYTCGYSPDDLQSHVQCNGNDPTQPGSSVQGKLMMILQITPTLSGTSRSACELAGSLGATVTYSVVGGDAYAGNAPVGVLSAAHSLPTFEVVADASYFRMVRVDGQYGAPDWHLSLGTDPVGACSTVIANQNIAW